MYFIDAAFIQNEIRRIKFPYIFYKLEKKAKFRAILLYYCMNINFMKIITYL